MGLFGRRARGAEWCGVCGNPMFLGPAGAWRCKWCDLHATSCQSRYHGPGQCPLGKREKTPPAGVWDHEFAAGEIPDAEFLA
jgi:hypothetical protein